MLKERRLVGTTCIVEEEKYKDCSTCERACKEAEAGQGWGCATVYFCCCFAASASSCCCDSHSLVAA